MVNKIVLNRIGGQELSEKARRLLAAHDREVDLSKNGAPNQEAA
jgi:hypothetical protein